MLDNIANTAYRTGALPETRGVMFMNHCERMSPLDAAALEYVLVIIV